MFPTGLGKGVSVGITFYIPPELGVPALHGDFPICLLLLIWKHQQQQGLCLPEAPADIPARAAQARVVQHTWTVNLAPPLSRSGMTLGRSQVLPEPRCSHPENGACLPNAAVR